jgi:hypothetical protein
MDKAFLAFSRVDSEQPGSVEYFHGSNSKRIQRNGYHYAQPEQAI